MRLAILLLGLLSFVANGDDSEHYIDVGQWQVSVALGLGAKSNPLVDGDDIPLVVVPDIAYYGESFYFDNGELGYTWLEEPQYTVSSVISLNTERAYFSFWHPANILVSNAALDNNTGDPLEPDQGSEYIVSVDDIANRSFAVDVGVKTQWYFDSGAWLSLAFFNDASGVYQGHHGVISYAHWIKFEQLKLLLTVGVNYKSSALVDYYYGIDQRDDVSEDLHYQAEQTISPVIKIDISQPINDDWQFLSFFRYEALGSGMKNSPLVNRRYAATGFVGVSYGF